jgi:DegV family protein with EDD domain
MTIKIVTDSSCDLPGELIKEYGIEVIPLFINMEGKSYEDGIDITRESFYKQLPTLTTHPTTSIPGIETIRLKFESLISQGADEILCIHIASSLSNMLNVARTAAESFRNMHFEFVDSGQISLGIGLQVLAAAMANKAGKSIGQIVEECEKLGKLTWSFAALNTLDFIHRGGRISTPQYNLGRLLSIKPLLIMHDGVIKFEKVFTFSNSIKRIISILEEIQPLQQAAYLHTAALDKLEAFKEKTKEFIPSGSDPLVGEVSPVIGVHVGPGAIGFVAIRD